MLENDTFAFINKIQLNDIAIFSRCVFLSLWRQVRPPIEIAKHDDHKEILQEAHHQNKGVIGAVLHYQRSSKVDEKDEELELKWSRSH